MELEFHQLDRKYAGLRIADAGRTARLVASLCEQGQQQPVLVVRGGGNDGGVDRYVLLAAEKPLLKRLPLYIPEVYELACRAFGT